MIKPQINTLDTENTNMRILPEQSNLERKPDEHGGLHVQGHIKIFDPESGEIFINKRNAIHYENISEAIAYTLANKGQSYIYEMHLVTVAQVLTQPGLSTICQAIPIQATVTCTTQLLLR